MPFAVAGQTPANGILQSTDPGGAEGMVGQRSAHYEPEYYITIYSLICGLFNESFSSSDYTSSHNRENHEK